MHRFALVLKLMKLGFLTNVFARRIPTTRVEYVLLVRQVLLQLRTLPLVLVQQLIRSSLLLQIPANARLQLVELAKAVFYVVTNHVSLEFVGVLLEQ